MCTLELLILIKVATATYCVRRHNKCYIVDTFTYSIYALLN